ncbi:MAG: DnaB domain protein helicase domain protein, partial [Phycisphaerales bacterium]|nr:DnaB domain protein helicase domain protein [Phycisphaerales bacterium]
MGRIFDEKGRMSEPLRLSDSSAQFDKLPPHSIVAEQCLVASMMLDKDLVGQVLPKVSPEAFYLADHAIIYGIIRNLYDANRPIDAIILREELSKRGQLDEIGGTAYLAEILNTVPSAANGMHYADIVRDKYLLRSLIGASNDAVREAYSPHDKVDEIIDRAEKRIFEIANKKISNHASPLGEVAMEVYEMLENSGRKGIETGFYELDDMLNGLQPGEMIIVAARPSMGKAQPLDAQVLTLDGFKPMGSLRLGDQLASVDGQSSSVVGVYPQGERQVYRVTLADGRSTECCAEHLWRVHFRGWESPRVLSTAKVMAMLQRQRYQGRIWIENFTGQFGSDEHLPVDPWLLGLLLGDGSLGGTSLRFSTADAETITRVRDTVGPDLTVTHAGKYDYRIVQTAGPSQVGTQGAVANPMTVALRQMGLWDKTAETKFIPGSYLVATRESRLRLLAGLLDSDGWVERFGVIRFSSASLQLAKDVVALARSLGGSGSFFPKKTTYTHLGETKPGQTAYVCNLQFPDATAAVLLQHKADRLAAKPRQRQRRLNITSIAPTRVTATQCIAVSHPAHLYVTDDYVVTHNTAFAMNLIEAMAGANQACAVFSLEMSRQQLAQRMMCSRAQIDAQRVRKGLLTAGEYQRLAMMVNEMNKMPIWVDDSPGLTPLELR